MAAFFGFRAFESAAPSQRVAVPAASRLLRKRAYQVWAPRLRAGTRRAAAAAGELVLFLWTVLVLAFALLIAAGFLT